MSDTNPQMQEGWRTLSRTNVKNKNKIPRHIIFKIQKIANIKKSLERRQRKNHLLFRGTKVRIRSTFTMQARRERDEIFDV